MKQNKLERDLAIVNPILAKAEIDSYSLCPCEVYALLNVYNVAFHDSGKIEGIASLDSSCSGCEFCQKMREAAKHDGTIICGKCYDAKLESYRTNIKDRHTLNLRIMSTVLFTVEELKNVPSMELDRINSSGDIANLVHARNMIRYAKAHPFAHVTIWSKNYPVMQKAFEIEGKPNNMIYVASSIRINEKIALPAFADYTFTVYTKDKIAEAIANGSMTCNGAKCRDCGFKCYYGTWPKGSDIAEVLRP